MLPISGGTKLFGAGGFPIEGLPIARPVGFDFAFESFAFDLAFVFGSGFSAVAFADDGEGDLVAGDFAVLNGGFVFVADDEAGEFFALEFELEDAFDAVAIGKDEGGVPIAAGKGSIGEVAFGEPIEGAGLAVDIEFAFAGDFMAGELAGIFDDERLAVELAVHFEGDVAVLEGAFLDFCFAELMGVAAGEFFAILLEGEDGFAGLAGEGPFPNTGGIGIASEGGEGCEGDRGEDEDKTFHKIG